MPATATRLLTATEAQIRSGRSMVRFRQWVAAGRLAFTLDDLGRRRFSVEDVDRLVADVDRYKLEDATAAADAP
jgi:predicted site-specific integrase-resolvase